MKVTNAREEMSHLICKSVLVDEHMDTKLP